MARHKDATWNLAAPSPGMDGAQVAVLMDIRDELKLNNELQRRILAVLECRNTSAIPHTLARIDRRLAKHLPLKAKP